MEVHLWIEVKDEDEEKFIDELEELCKKYGGKNYHFTFKS